MAQLNLLRQLPNQQSGRTGYSMILTVTSSEDISEYVFVKMRTISSDKVTTQDDFVAVATLAQLEDFNEQAPAAGCSYWRDKTVTITVRTPEYLDFVYNTILAEIQRLVVDFNINTDYSESNNLTVTVDSNFPPQPVMAPITYSPTGASPSLNINLALAKYFILDLTGATGTLQLTLSNAVAGTTRRIEVREGAAAVNITFPTNTLQARGGGNLYTATGINTVDVVVVEYDNENFLIQSEQGYS